MDQLHSCGRRGPADDAPRLERLEGGAQSILGGLLPFHGSTWFFKFLGSSGTVLGNEAKMKAFLDSVQLEASHH